MWRVKPEPPSTCRQSKKWSRSPGSSPFFGVFCSLNVWAWNHKVRRGKEQWQRWIFHGDPAWSHGCWPCFSSETWSKHGTDCRSWGSSLFLSIFFASLLQNRTGWQCIMHGASCVEWERTVGPEGSAGEKKSVQIHILQRWSPGTSTGGDGGKRLVCLCPRSSVPAFVLKITINSGFLVHLRRQATTALFHLSVDIYRSPTVASGVTFAECIKWQRVTVSSSRRTDLTFSSAAIFLSVGGAEASLGIEVTCLTDVMIYQFGLCCVNSFSLAT